MIDEENKKLQLGEVIECSPLDAHMIHIYLHSEFLKNNANSKNVEGILSHIREHVDMLEEECIRLN